MILPVQRDTSEEGHIGDWHTSVDGTQTPPTRERIICKYLRVQLCKGLLKYGCSFLLRSLCGSKAVISLCRFLWVQKRDILSCLLVYYC